MLIDQKKLDLYVKKNFNVLFEGERGVGKTAVISNTFLNAGLRVKYFSAPTMDPWTDLVGVPTTIVREDKKEVLRIIAPEEFVDDKYDVIFIDELNRAPKKVMNALMELIQFKTINGRPYNIKMIWAAINPYNEDEEDYHVEPLDKALEDRFQVKVKFPYKVDIDFFKKHYEQVGEIFCHWWDNQPLDIRKEISPRRLFETAGFFMDGGDLKDMITVGNTNKLKDDLKSVNQLQLLKADFNDKKVEQSLKILNKNYTVVIGNYFKSKLDIFEFFLPYLDKEWLAQEFILGGQIFEYMLKISKTIKSPNNQCVTEIIQSIIKVGGIESAFVRRKIVQLKDFISEQEKEKYKRKILNNSLVPKNKEEAMCIKGIEDKKLMNSKKILTSDLITLYNWSSISNLCNLMENGINNKNFTLEDIKNQFCERISMVLATALLENNNATTIKTIKALTDSKDSSYIWKKDNISSIFKDFGIVIKEKVEQYTQKTKEEIKEMYQERTEKHELNF